MVSRRGLFQALGGLMVAGNASAGVMSPKQINASGWLHPKQALMPEDAYCPVCKHPICYARARMAEMPAKDGYTTYEIVGWIYYHRYTAGVCDQSI